MRFITEAHTTIELDVPSDDGETEVEVEIEASGTYYEREGGWTLVSLEIYGKDDGPVPAKIQEYIDFLNRKHLLHRNTHPALWLEDAIVESFERSSRDVEWEPEVYND